MDNNTFTAPEKRVAMAHVINLMTVACMDGKVAQEELQVINNIAQAYGLNEEEFNQCSSMCNECIKKGTSVVEMPQSDDDKATFIKNLVFTMMADGEINENERQYVEFLADRFGFKAKEFVDFLIQKIVDEYGQQDNDQELEEAIIQGKEALLKNDIVKAFEVLYNPAHLDQTARRLFLMIPEIEKRMCLLTMDHEDFLEEEAKKGDALAQYTLGRFHQAHGNSFNEARDLFIAAAKTGMGDPIAALALLLLNGQLSGVEVDRDKYYQGMLEAVDKGSVLGQYYIYRAALTGFNGNPANPQAVIDNIKEWLNGDESEDILQINPTYYEILAQAYDRIGDGKTAAEYYMKAVRMGRVDLYHEWVLNTFFDDNLEMTDPEGYEKAIEDGIAMGNSYCYLLRADLNQGRYDESNNAQEKAEISKQIDQDLYTAGEMGEGYGYYMLGHHQYYGNYGITRDTTTAWLNFLDASGRKIPEAWTMMGQMHLDGEAPKDLGHNFVSYCRLMAYRQGDKDMLIPVIISFYGGYLESYRDEIKKYYLPEYEALPDEVKTDYFGIQFIAAVNTSGEANIIQFDFETEEWSEVEELIDAQRLEALHSKQLDKIADEMGLEGRLTAWVDSDRVAKNLEVNPISKKFFDSPVQGDIVFTLEDDEYHPQTFELSEIKKIVVALGGEIDHVFYEEFPDDDGRWDPQA